MLSSVLIRNLAVIKEIQIDFNKGFTVLTGETGAGKSILIDALFLILGARVSKDIIRKGEKSVFVEASFYIADCKNEILNEYLCDDTVIISREVFCDGKNVVRINSRTANTAVLKELAPYLISIHSQNDNQILFNSELHYKFLDVYGECTKMYDDYFNVYRQYNSVLNEIKKISESQEADAGRIDYLKFVKEEIENADVTVDEEIKLKDEKKAIKESLLMTTAVNTAYYSLFEGERSACSLIGDAADAIKNIDTLSEFSQRLNDLREEIIDVTDNIQSVYDGMKEEYRDINDIEERLNEIYILKSKYGGSVEAALKRLEEVTVELDDIENHEYKTKQLEEKKKKLYGELSSMAEKLSQKRHIEAVKLSQAIENELHDLMMPNAKFEIFFDETQGYTKFGKETVCFLFSANAGMEVQPLNKIASGGEISRVNLAIKSVLYNIDPACAFIFDEIDVGISGRAAQKTGEKMYGLSQNNQILCVTHLPQIAAMADNHLLVSKNEDVGMTQTTIKYINGSERVNELARILGGVEVTQLTLENAEETLKLAGDFKKGINKAI